jgi:hypothetical protein
LEGDLAVAVDERGDAEAEDDGLELDLGGDAELAIATGVDGVGGGGGDGDGSTAGDVSGLVVHGEQGGAGDDLEVAVASEGFDDDVDAVVDAAVGGEAADRDAEIIDGFDFVRVEETGGGVAEEAGTGAAEFVDFEAGGAEEVVDAELEVVGEVHFADDDVDDDLARADVELAEDFIEDAEVFGGAGEEEAVVEVPVSYIADNLIAMNYNFEDLVKIFVNESAFTEQDERSLRILDVIDSLVDRYEGESVPTTTPVVATPVVATSNTDDEDDDLDRSDLPIWYEDLDADERSGRPLVSEGPTPDAPLDQRRANSAVVQHALDGHPCGVGVP